MSHAPSQTEAESLYTNLEQMSVPDLLTAINTEDHKVAHAVAQALPQIERLVTATVAQMKQGGRLFYLGAGTSGRLAIVDASECPPTYGVSPDMVIALMAGGDAAIRHSAEGAEDHATQGWHDLQAHHVTPQDFVIGVAASGRTPYVLGALQSCCAANIPTGCIVCNAQSVIAAASDYPVEVIVGPEFVTGSTRMKAGTAQKLVLNMISTVAMIQLGRVKGNRMVHMQLSNDKLVARGIDMVMQARGCDAETAAQLLRQHGSVAAAIAVD